jgi:predicted enzyme related to lactoylglutathione lyase
MEGKVTNVSLVVRDQARALEFYTEKVGFDKKTDITGPGGFRWVTVAPKGQDLEFVLYALGSGTTPEQLAREKKFAPGASPPTIIQVADCRAIYEQLRSKGVAFLQPPQDNPWGTTAIFEDPDGNAFSINQYSARR